MNTSRPLFVLVPSLFLALVLSACGAPPATETQAPEPTAVQAAPSGEVQALPTETLPEAPPSAPASGGAQVSFANDVYPVLESRCLNCHGGDQTREGLSVKTYADLMKGSDNGAVLVPGDAANSLLVELVTNQKMPKRGPKLTPPQAQLLADWVNQGALDN